MQLPAKRALTNQHPTPSLRQRALLHQSGQRANQDPVSLVRFQPAYAENQKIIRQETNLFAQRLSPRRSVGSIALCDLNRIGDDGDDIWTDVKMCDDGAQQRSIRRNNSIGGSGASPDSEAKREICDAFQRRARRIGRAKFLQALWIEHKRCSRRLAVPKRVAQHARPQAVDNIDLRLRPRAGLRPARHAGQREDMRCSCPGSSFRGGWRMGKS